MATKKKFKPKAFESTGVSSDVSANIYNSMIFSNAWNDLTKNQRLLYLYCKSILFCLFFIFVYLVYISYTSNCYKHYSYQNHH